MKMIDVLGQLSVPISNEESAVVDKMSESEQFTTDKLNEREEEVLRGLVIKGVVTERKTESGIYFIVNEI